MGRLRRHAEGLWTVEGPPVGRSPLGTRMTVLGLGGGRLVLHSPVEINEELRAEIGALGRVEFLLAPNRLHHVFLGSAARLYPDARLVGAPGLAAKRADLGFSSVVEDAGLPEWGSEIETHRIRGLPILEEVACWHRASRTLVLTDLCFNVQRSASIASRMFFRANGMWQRFGPSRLMRLFVRDRAALRGSIARILDWDFDRIVVAHGDVVERDGKRALRGAWLS